MPEPSFDFINFFEGHTRASGWFCDRFGNVKRHFWGDFVGQCEGRALHLDEQLFYSDGMHESRVWRATVDVRGHFEATSDSLLGPATGHQSGNSLRIRYAMDILVAPEKSWALSFDDRFLFQSDGSLHNINVVRKWGVRIGTVSTQYLRHDGTQTCAQTSKACSPVQWAPAHKQRAA